MDNSTDSLITARLLATARYTVVLNVLLFALSAQRGGTWSAVQLILAAALLYYHIRIEFDRRVFQDFADGRYTPEAFDQTLRQTGLRRVSDDPSLPYNAVFCFRFPNDHHDRIHPPPCRLAQARHRRPARLQKYQQPHPAARRLVRQYLRNPFPAQIRRYRPYVGSAR